MFMSMTGFGRSIRTSSLGRLVVEIQSVNRKFLEIGVSLPKEMGRFETDVRKWVGESLRRGHVSVRISFIPDQEQVLLPSKEQLKAHRKAWTRLAREAGCKEEEVTLSFLVKTLPVYSVELGEKESLNLLKNGVKEAMEKLMAMKEKEGSALEKEIVRHLQELKKLVVLIKKQAPFAREATQQRIRQQMQEPLDDRMIQAIVAYSDRSDITEELARLDSHCKQFRTIQEGRTLDFMVQEMAREINTVGSKSDDLAISHSVVAAKGVLEKIKEQLQNIE